jgi:uncharacterized protein
VLQYATRRADSLPSTNAQIVGKPACKLPTLGANHCIIEEISVAKSRTEQLVERLRDLQASSADVEAAAIVSVDGLSMASSMPANIEEDRVSAMSAAMLSLGERIASELGRGSLDQVYVKGQHGYVILMSVGDEAVLTVLAREQAKLGLIFLDMGRAVKELAKLV